MAAQTSAPAGGRETAPRRRRGAASVWQPYLMLAPALILLLAFTIYPILAAGYMSLFKINMATQQQMVWAGLDNYRELFASGLFRQVMKNTFIFAFGTTPFSVGLALFLAVQLNKRFRGSALFRTVFFYPTVIPMMSAATIWLFMYTPQYGVIGRILALFGVAEVNLLGNSATALPAIMLMTVWKEAGYFMLFYLAGLQNLPEELYEAADLDGASGWAQFRFLTLPLLMPTTLFVTTVSLINAFKTVDQLFLMTAGGPNNATNLLLYHLYEQAFSFYDRGKAAALTVILVGILMILAIIQNQWVDKRIHYH
ncbi:carbohydrate ABC transporter permease [Symbiobacterium thermophilum]|uniref:ABC transporter permease n=1 Tax=Symbiobacterium thermophilum TaxID=2734 RepID=A0A953IC58_SYMTR|nr:sugar ABC transporter permease [Symbiobacterium thermophilum]MBY6277541.1 ABC transporter permease [Symbiobacterium thermophilum]